MVRVCCVDGCPGESDSTEDIRFFRFPKSAPAAAAWRAALRVSARLHGNSLVCARHFARDVCRGGRLPPYCVPTRNLGHGVTEDSTSCDQKDASKEDLKDAGDSASDAKDPEDDRTRRRRRGDTSSLAQTEGRRLRKSTRGRKGREREGTSEGGGGREREGTSEGGSGDIGGDVVGVGDGPNSTQLQEGPIRNSTESPTEGAGSAEKDDKKDEGTESPSSPSDNTPKSSTLNGFLNDDNTSDKSINDKPAPKSPPDPLNKASEHLEINEDRLTEPSHREPIQQTETAIAPKDSVERDGEISETIPNSNVATEVRTSRHPSLDDQSKTFMNLDEERERENQACDEKKVKSDKDPLEREGEGAISLDGDIDSQHTGSPDCLMLVESLQVELDPHAVFTPQDSDTDDDDVQMLDDKPEEVSLLTSSDESDVILQEPHIDTVEVSDATDEDDMPLTKLCEKSAKIKSIFWGTSYQYYCYECGFSATSKSTLKEHKKTHETSLREQTILICSVCGFQSSSQSQYARHVRKHKGEKKYRCGVCNYKAKHRMSLVYHMRVHKDSRNVLKCKQCEFKTKSRFDMQDHLTEDHGLLAFFCDTCAYSTKRKSDLTRHMKTKHRQW